MRSAVRQNDCRITKGEADEAGELNDLQHVAQLEQPRESGHTTGVGVGFRD
jgi:hypothetical protein